MCLFNAEITEQGAVIYTSQSSYAQLAMAWTSGLWESRSLNRSRESKDTHLHTAAYEIWQPTTVAQKDIRIFRFPFPISHFSFSVLRSRFAFLVSHRSFPVLRSRFVFFVISPFSQPFPIRTQYNYLCGLVSRYSTPLIIPDALWRWLTEVS